MKIKLLTLIIASILLVGCGEEVDLTKVSSDIIIKL